MNAIAEIIRLNHEVEQSMAEIARLRAECVRLEDHINDADDLIICLRADNERLTALLSEAERLYSSYGIEARSKDCGPWINNVRAALAADGKGE